MEPSLGDGFHRPTRARTDGAQERLDTPDAMDVGAWQPPTQPVPGSSQHPHAQGGADQVYNELIHHPPLMGATLEGLGVKVTAGQTLPSQARVSGAGLMPAFENSVPSAWHTRQEMPVRTTCRAEQGPELEGARGAHLVASTVHATATAAQALSRAALKTRPQPVAAAPKVDVWEDDSVEHLADQPAPRAFKYPRALVQASSNAKGPPTPSHDDGVERPTAPSGARSALKRKRHLPGADASDADFTTPPPCSAAGASSTAASAASFRPRAVIASAADAAADAAGALRRAADAGADDAGAADAGADDAGAADAAADDAAAASSSVLAASASASAATSSTAAIAAPAAFAAWDSLVPEHVVGRRRLAVVAALQRHANPQLLAKPPATYDAKQDILQRDAKGLVRCPHCLMGGFAHKGAVSNHIKQCTGCEECEIDKCIRKIETKNPKVGTDVEYEYGFMSQAAKIALKGPVRLARFESHLLHLEGNNAKGPGSVTARRRARTA
jgi:hypothetical protein